MERTDQGRSRKEFRSSHMERKSYLAVTLDIES